MSVYKTWTKEILLSVPLQLLQTVFLYPLARYTEFTQLFSNHIYGEIFPQRIKYMRLRRSQGSVLCNSSCYRLVYFWGRLAKSRTRLSDWTELNWTEGSGKEPDAGRDWGQEEKGTTEDEMAGWHHWLDGRECEWTLGVGDGQGRLACGSPWGHKESDTTERLNWTEGNGKTICLRNHMSLAQIVSFLKCTNTYILIFWI